MTVSVANAKLRSRRGWVLAALMAWGIIGMPLMMVGLLAGLLHHGIELLAPLIYMTGVAGLGIAHPRWLKSMAGALRLDETGVVLNGRRIAKRNALTHGHVIREGAKLFLRLAPSSMNASPLDIEVTCVAQGKEMLAALRLDRTVAEYTMVDSHRKRDFQRTAALVGGSVVLGVFGFAFTLAIARHHSLGHNHLATAALAITYFATLVGIVTGFVSRDMLVAVGLDGVMLRHRLVSKRFVSFRQIRDVALVDRNVTLTLTNNTTVELHHREETEKEAENLVARIRAGIEAFSAAPQHAGEAVARNGQSIAEWIAKSKQRNEQNASYRAAIVPEEELWRIVEDAAAAPTERAGAALALRQGLDDEGKIRLRIAAGACAEKKLRVALESAATADEDALAEALEPLEDGDTKPARMALP